MERMSSGHIGFLREAEAHDAHDELLPNEFGAVSPSFAIADESLVDLPLPPPCGSGDRISVPNVSCEEEELHDDLDLGDAVLKFINQILMEEDEEEEYYSSALEESSSSALLNTEKSFYEVLGEKYPPLPDVVDTQPTFSSEILGNANANHVYGELGGQNSNWVCCDDDDDASGNHPNPRHCCGVSEQQHRSFFSLSSTLISNNLNNAFAIAEDFRMPPPGESVSQSAGGSGEAGMLGFNEGNNFLFNLKSGELLAMGSKTEAKIPVEAAKKDETLCLADVSRGRKHPHCFGDYNLLDCGRSSKQLAAAASGGETSVGSEMFDEVLLCKAEEGESATREALRNRIGKRIVRQNKGQKSRGSNSGKNRHRSSERIELLVDLKWLLTLCAQAIATNNRSGCDELLKKIRKHSSTAGDGMQRLASYFAGGLEARILGTGSRSYTALLVKPITPAEFLKSHHLFLSICPFVKLFYFFSNKTILQAAEKARTLHVVVFGIYFGYQWPSFIEQLSSRLGGPPKLRITGIDLPRPGKRPAERIEETGRRLADYAERFNVPFEFNPIAQKYELIGLKDIKLESDEVVAVSQLLQFRYLLDETVALESPRNTVLNLIRKMNPKVFVMAEESVGLDVPFFETRFLEAVSYYSALFDMCDANVPREVPERATMEEIFGQEIMNIIACEGRERIERPETYKQWQARIERAGFRQLRLRDKMFRVAKERVESFYHKDYLVERDGQWLLQGWKGRITHAFSCWKPFPFHEANN